MYEIEADLTNPASSATFTQTDLNNAAVTPQFHNLDSTVDASTVGVYSFTLKAKFDHASNVYDTMPNSGSQAYTITIINGLATLDPPASMPSDQVYIVGDLELSVTFETFILTLSGGTISYSYTIVPDPSPNLVLNLDGSTRTF